ncbi:MAG: ORF6N domain-containing protein [Bacteroidia bacterium]|nr:ORF6N domain-containing protein [Bacteroidia bacterium]
MGLASMAAIQQKIHKIRNQDVILDFDLAAIYEVDTKTMTAAIKSNRKRFSDAFMFQLTREEIRAILPDYSRHKQPPFAFTVLGALLCSGILDSDVAIQASQEIVKGFVALVQE